jgi:capsular exopolysaccharide synthesis family protein
MVQQGRRTPRDKQRKRRFFSEALGLGRGHENAEPKKYPQLPVTIEDPAGPASEAYRTLRTNLLFARVDSPPKAIVVTSPGPGEGKSTTSANLAVVLAQANKSTLIMDCDFRKPVLHKIFRLRNIRGVVNALAGEHGLSEIWQQPLPGLNVVTSGTIPPNPAELVGSRRFAELIEQAREEFDYVLIDSPPTEAVSDAMIASTQADGVLLVLDAQNTRKGVLWQAMRNLEAVGGTVLGTVMNNFEGAKGKYYYQYTYGDGYGR